MVDAVVGGFGGAEVAGGCDGRVGLVGVVGVEDEDEKADAMVEGAAGSGRMVPVGAVVCSRSLAVVGASLLVLALRGWEVVRIEGLRRRLVRMLVVVVLLNGKREAAGLPAGKKLLVVAAADWAARAVELGWPGWLEKFDYHEPVQDWDWLERAKAPGQHELVEGRAVVLVVFALVVPSSVPRASR